MKLELDSDTFADWLRNEASCENLVFQALDLRPFDQELARRPQATRAEDACVLLGCEVGPAFAAQVAQHHGIVFPDLPGRPYRAYRPSLYSVEELFAGFDPARPETYFSTPDWLTFRSFIKVDANNHPLRPMQFVKVGPEEILARRLHDHFIENETAEFLEHFRVPQGKGIVAIMGGHDRLRSDPVFRSLAELARALTRDGFLVASGGGPGLMEASNLGAYFAPQPDEALSIAIERLRVADRYDHPDWLKVAWEVRRDFLSPDRSKSRSFGVPTWFYGHEPPNLFATDIAKYFENSFREEGLLAIATHGVIFAEGNAGTVQEIFQDACQNYYSNYDFPSPMILLGEEYWNPTPDAEGNYPEKRKPAWPLLKKLAVDGRFERLVTLTSSTEVALERIREFRAPGQ
jgi:predicted Rossmann-fold nucleotide-binding protein